MTLLPARRPKDECVADALVATTHESALAAFKNRPTRQLRLAAGAGAGACSVLSATAPFLFFAEAKGFAGLVVVYAFIGVMIAAMLGTVLNTMTLPKKFVARSTARRLQRLDAEYGWRPRVGAPHPAGRDDVHDRFVIERTPVAGGIQVQLTRYHYDGVAWQPIEWEGGNTRAFGPDEDDELAEFVSDLRASVPDLEHAAVETLADERVEAERVSAWQARQRGAELVV